MPILHIVQTPVQDVKELPVNTVRKAPIPKIETQSSNILQSETKERKIIKQLSTSGCVKFGLTPVSKQKADMSLTARTGIMKEL